jgi:CHAD domain-containing protein
MASPGQVENERKYDADTSTPLPALSDIPGVERVAEPVSDHLEAVYFDTPSLGLAARRITLRRRTGGADHGWHLKLPAGEDRRQEIHAPLGRPDAVPEELEDQLRVYTRGEELMPVARLTTHRTTYRLYAPGGEHLADFADDQVDAETVHPVQKEQHWREWEIELVHGAERFFAAAEVALTRTGARRSGHASKLARAIGGAWPRERGTGKGPPRKKGPAVDVVTAYLDERIQELFTHDPGVRLETPDAVHQMRSATRRMRSALATYRKLFGASGAKNLRDEIKWLARILGRARDAEVMRERLRQHLGELPGEGSSGALPGPLDHELGASYDASYQEVIATLGTGRYYRLLDSLEDFRDHPPATHLASRPARKVTAGRVDKSAKRLGRARKAAARAAAGADRDAALHQVRKDAKRLRHAAESVAGIHGKRARKLGKSARRLQDILGDHQDSVMARALLARLAAAPDLPADTARSYAGLLEIEERIARDTEDQYRKAVKKKALDIRLRH